MIRIVIDPSLVLSAAWGEVVDALKPSPIGTSMSLLDALERGDDQTLRPFRSPLRRFGLPARSTARMDTVRRLNERVALTGSLGECLAEAPRTIVEEIGAALGTGALLLARRLETLELMASLELEIALVGPVAYDELVYALEAQSVRSIRRHVRYAARKRQDGRIEVASRSARLA